ncbi:hypothetical protein HK414_06055 [Ramlibacter terrae]|uniref:Uncharacterized protein n=1 Tax=Ramlibacter terrae TaxID=2732511 RepID=A0ABX6P109_9BURK|nr:hypothetical protein HK414_06055 [Ramlibacter terrae]
MRRRIAFALAIACVAGVPLAQAAQQRGLMPVSVTVVNTCFFGQQARCHLPGTLLRTHVERPSDGAAATEGRRVTHL